MLAQARNIDGHENIPRQQLDHTLETLSAPSLESKSNSKAKERSSFKAKLKVTLKSKAKTKSKPEPKST